VSCRKLSDSYIRLLPAPPLSSLFPYTTLFRSLLVYDRARQVMEVRAVGPRTELARADVANHASHDGIGVAEILEGPQVSQRRRSDRKSTRLNSSHRTISYAVYCLQKKDGRRKK